MIASNVVRFFSWPSICASGSGVSAIPSSEAIGRRQRPYHYLAGIDPNPRLQAGNLLSDEPGIYIRGEFGIRLEDDLLITESGSELLTPQSPSLEDPFGKA